MKNLFSLILMVSVLFLASCSKTDDPTPSAPNTPTTPTTPTVQTNLDKVKATLVGTWTFQSVKVTEISTSKSATTSTCAKTELKAAGLFTNTTWQNITPLPNFTYVSTTSVNVNYPCLVGSPTSTESITLVENSDGTVTMTIPNQNSYKVNPSDITTTSIKANLVNANGYIVEYQFKR